MRAALLGRVDKQADPVALHPVCDPHLGTVDDIVIAVTFGICPRIGDIRSGGFLTHTDTANHLACDCRHQKFLLELLTAIIGEGGGAHGCLNADGGGNAIRANAAERFCKNHFIGEIKI